MTYTADELKAVLGAHGEWLGGRCGKRANLSWSDLSRANLSGANLSWSDLSRADLSRADLSEANLSGADLSRADLSEANLSGAHLSWAHLSGANLSRAHLSRADLSGADLSEANLSGAHLSGDVNWETYTTEIVPALLKAGVVPVEQIVTPEHWECHEWNNCPMAAAFGVKAVAQVPAIYRSEAARFVELFDARALPIDKVREWCGLPALVSK